MDKNNSGRRPRLQFDVSPNVEEIFDALLEVTRLRNKSLLFDVMVSTYADLANRICSNERIISVRPDGTWDELQDLALERLNPRKPTFSGDTLPKAEIMVSLSRASEKH